MPYCKARILKIRLYIQTCFRTLHSPLYQKEFQKKSLSPLIYSVRIPVFNSNKDSTVRHHILILRNKLDNYYRNEGKKINSDWLSLKDIMRFNHTFKIEHPKILDRIISSLKRWEVVVIVILLFINLFVIFRQNQCKLSLIRSSNTVFC